jgi:hypothetical protein
MKPLQELNLLQRIALATAITAFAVLVLIFVSWLANEKADAQQQTPPDLYEGIPIDAKLLHLDKLALDEAYDDQVRHLFRIWLRGGVVSNKEITTGLKNARQAYNIAASQISKREQQALENQQERDNKAEQTK